MAFKFLDFEVTGRQGTFPSDMLRYDSCWPVDVESASNIIAERDREHPSKVVTVRLRSTREPTPGRWNSFLWSCSKAKRSS